MNAGTRADHNQFCLTEGWELVRGAQGRPVRHHVIYERDLPDLQILRTPVSPAGRQDDLRAYALEDHPA